MDPLFDLEDSSFTLSVATTSPQHITLANVNEGIASKGTVTGRRQPRLLRVTQNIMKTCWEAGKKQWQSTEHQGPSIQSILEATLFKEVMQISARGRMRS